MSACKAGPHREEEDEAEAGGWSSHLGVREEESGWRAGRKFDVMCLARRNESSCSDDYVIDFWSAIPQANTSIVRSSLWR